MTEIMPMTTLSPNEVEEDYRLSIDTLTQQFIEVIRKRLGIIVRGQQIIDLHRTILDACLKFNQTPDHYLKTITECPAHSVWLEYLTSGITIGDTYFFRDKQQMYLLQHKILPAIIKNKRLNNDLSLRIWSAGCGTGEEIYTIAIMLQELLPDILDWKLHLLATDINVMLLQKALLGNYGPLSLRAVSQALKEKYFSQEKNRYVILPKLKKGIQFVYLNLNEDPFPSLINQTQAQDLILCRHVLTYFDASQVARLMKKMAASLTPGGFLLLGATDPINIGNSGLIYHYHEGALFSHAMEITSSAIEKNSLSLTEKTALPYKSLNDVAKIIKNTTAASAKKRIAVPAQLDMPNLLAPDQQVHESTLEHLLRLQTDGRWQEMIDTIEVNANEDMSKITMLNMKSAAEAKLGKLHEAMKTCEESLIIDPACPETYFNLAMLWLALDNKDEAEAALRKSIFLNHDFALAQYELGLLLLRQNERNAGIKCLQKAMDAAAANGPSQQVLGCQEIHYQRFAEMIEHMINLYSIGE